MINTVHTTTVMEPSKRAAGFYPRCCQYNRCLNPRVVHPARQTQRRSRDNAGGLQRTFNDNAVD